MIKISKQQAHKRFKTLPQNIKDSIFSEDDADLIQKTGEQNHLSQEKISGLASILSYIFLGFVYHEDLQKELEQTLHLNHQAAVALAQIIKEKLIDPYESDLEKIYRPLSEEDFGLAPDRRVEERNTIPRPVLMKETPGPTILRQEDTVPKPGAQIPKPNAAVPRPGAPVPMPGSRNSGISTPVAPQPPEFSLPGKRPEVKTPIPSVPKPTAPAPAQAFTRPQVLSPFSFQKEARPLNAPSEFKLGGISKPNMANVPKTPTPPRPARVELGKEEIKKVPAPESKIVGREPVHYTEPKSAFMPAGAQRPQTGPTAPLAPKKPEVPLPSYPRPIPKNNADAVPNPTIH